MMELLLNLAWLLLALPAYWLLQRTDRRASWRYLLTLGCAMVLLFPVISATDDLHAMRPEMEESSPGKRSLKQAANEKTPIQQRFGSLPAELVSLEFGSACHEFVGRVLQAEIPAAHSLALNSFSVRAPPAA